jgi:hypothetical protein
MSLDGEVLLFWEMSNGAAFHMLLPRPNEFGEVSLAEHLGFNPFTYSDVVRIQLERHQPACAPSEETCKRMIQIVEAHPEFQLLRQGEELAVELRAFE